MTLFSFSELNANEPGTECIVWSIFVMRTTQKKPFNVDLTLREVEEMLCMPGFLVQ